MNSDGYTRQFDGPTPPPAGYSHPKGPSPASMQNNPYSNDDIEYDKLQDEFGIPLEEAPQQGYRDKWWAVAYIVCLVAMLCYTGYAAVVYFDTIRAYNEYFEILRQEDPDIVSPQITLPLRVFVFNVSMALLMPIVSGLILLVFLRKRPYPTILTLYVMGIIASAGLCIYFVIRNSIGLAFSCGIMLVILLINFFNLRSKFRYVSALIYEASQVSKKHPATFVVITVAVLVQIIFAFLFTFDMSVLAIGYNNSKDKPVGILALLAVLGALAYWTVNVIQSVVTITLSGTFASSYFQSIEHPHGEVVLNVNNPTRNAAKRALTTSFGSACFGAFVISIVQIVRYIAASISNNQSSDAMKFVCCIFQLLFRMFEWFIKYICYMTYVRIGIYGEPFMTSARNTCKMFTNHKGLDVIMSNYIVETIVTVGTIVCTTISSVLFVFFQTAVLAPYPKDHVAHGYADYFVALNIVFSYLIVSSILKPITVGTDTLVLCIAENPAVLLAQRPALAQRLIMAYPQLAETLTSLQAEDKYAV